MRLRRAVELTLSSVRRNGLRGTAQRIARYASQWRELRRKEREGKRFDAAHGVDTTGWVWSSELDTASENREFAVRYEPTSVAEFELLMGKLDVDHREFTFVDYGSGKGRVLMLAAQYPFKRILGVEFAESLDRVAHLNIATLGTDAERIQTYLMDATEFEPPPGPFVGYFFHPFGVPPLRRVLERITRSLASDPRPAYVVVTGPPELAATIEETGFERVDVEELGWMTRGVFTAPSGWTTPARRRDESVATAETG